MKIQKRILALAIAFLLTASLPLCAYAQVHEISGGKDGIAEAELPTDQASENTPDKTENNSPVKSPDDIIEIELPTGLSPEDGESMPSEGDVDSNEQPPQDERPSLDPTEGGINPPEHAVEMSFPDNVDFYMVSLGSGMSGIVFSDRFTVKNEGLEPAILNLDSIVTSVSDSSIYNVCSTPDLPSSGNNVYIELKGYYGDQEIILPLSAQGLRHENNIILESGEEFQFEFQGSINQDDYVWEDGSVSIRINFGFVSLNDEEEGPEDDEEDPEDDENLDGEDLESDEDDIEDEDPDADENDPEDEDSDSDDSDPEDEGSDADDSDPEDEDSDADENEDSKGENETGGDDDIDPDNDEQDNQPEELPEDLDNDPDYVGGGGGGNSDAPDNEDTDEGSDDSEDGEQGPDPDEIGDGDSDEDQDIPPEESDKDIEPEDTEGEDTPEDPEDDDADTEPEDIPDSDSEDGSDTEQPEIPPADEQSPPPISGDGTADSPLEIDTIKSLGAFVRAFDQGTLDEVTDLGKPYEEEPVHIKVASETMCYLFNGLAPKEMIANTIIDVEMISQPKPENDKTGILGFFRSNFS